MGRGAVNLNYCCSVLRKVQILHGEGPPLQALPPLRHSWGSHNNKFLSEESMVQASPPNPETAELLSSSRDRR